MQSSRILTVSVLGAAMILACSCGSNSGGSPNTGEADAGAAEVRRLGIESLGQGEGQVLVNGMACESLPCELEFPKGTAVTLEAAPSLNSNFGGWSLVCGASPACELTVENDILMGATFNVAGALSAQSTVADFTALPTAVGPDGSIYVAGAYRDNPPADFEVPAPLQFVGFYAKLSPSGGAPLWIRNFSLGSGIDTNYADVAVTPEGQVYLVAHGLFQTNSVIQRINPDTGAVLWTVSSTARVEHLKVDGLGNLFALGIVGTDKIYGIGTFNFPLQATLTHFGAKISSAGGVTAPSLMPAGPTLVKGVVALPGGGIFVSRGVDTDVGAHSLDHFAASGALDDSVSVPGSGQLALAANGDLIIAGLYRHALDWGDSPDLKAPAPNVSGFLVGRWRQDGTPLWLRVADTSNESPGFYSDTFGDALVVGPYGNIFISGVLVDAGSMSVGGDPLPRFGAVDGFMASLSPDGGYRWSISVGAADNGASPLGFTMMFIDANGTLRGILRHETPVSTELGELAAGLSIIEFER